MKKIASHIKIGQSGEDIAFQYLKNNKFKILERNYRQNWGEIDIVAKKKKVLHFVEVKTVSCVTDFDNYIPEENVHQHKRKRLAKTISTYLQEKNVPHETEFQLDVVSVYVNKERGECKIRLLEDAILLEA